MNMKNKNPFLVHNYKYLITFLWCYSSLFCSAIDTMKYGDWIRDNVNSREKTIKLVSAKEMFELGFFTPKGSPSEKRYIGIWYYNLSPKTVVWVANRENPLVTTSRTRGGTFGIGEDGNLQLFDYKGRSFWSSNLESSSSSNRTLTLLDTGNLVLTEYNGIRLWESFKNPTDTFLPGMKMDENESLTLTSWKDEFDPYNGDISFTKGEGTNSYMIRNKTGTRWKSAEVSMFLSSNQMPTTITNFLENKRGVAHKNTTYKTGPEISNYNYSRLVINSNGKLEYLSWDQNWTVAWSVPSDRCDGLNICGDFGICNSNEQMRSCRCLPGFKSSLVEEWYSGDYSDVCSRGAKLCNGNDSFLGLKMMKVGRRDSTTSIQVNNVTECEKTCRDDCKCQAYSLETHQNSWNRGDSTQTNLSCWTWSENLNDLQEENITKDGVHTFFVRVALSNLKDETSNPRIVKPRRRKSLYLIVSLTVTSVIVLSIIIISFISWRKRKTKRRENRKLFDQQNRALNKLDTERHIQELMNSSEIKEEDEKGIDVPFFTLESILTATNNLSVENKLGQGGYGPVYKGKFPGGQEIAVKKLSSVSRQGIHEFKNEVILIAKLQHRNLVRLRGYCIEKEEMILLYEYMPNKSLDAFIFDDTKRALLNWEIRFDIIMGIARGLLYLHQDSRLRIIHRDLKTSNILLDCDMNPKISDFGLARMVGGKKTEDNTNRVVGTYGYMSPEYVQGGVFSVKSDVFSFGVVLLEIVSGKGSTRFVHFECDEPLSLLGYVWKLWTESKVLELMDQTLEESYKEDQLIKCVNIGLLCVQEEASDRPNMSNIVTMLDCDFVTLPSPKQPAFVHRRDSSSTPSSSNKPGTNAEISYTMEEGR
ncbi:hypothetical protein CsatA_016832 [Cannabis sativa]